MATLDWSQCPAVESVLMPLRCILRSAVSLNALFISICAMLRASLTDRHGSALRIKRPVS